MTKPIKITASIVLVLAAVLFIAAKTATIHVGPDFIIPSQPPREPLSAWQPALGREKVHTSISGVELRGFRYPGADPSQPTVLFFYGNGGTTLRMDRFLSGLASQGPTVVVYDYRGYGFSGGKTHLADFCEDGLALYDQTVTATPSHRVVVYGASMGTTVASYVAAQRHTEAVILGMPIASAEEEGPVFLKMTSVPSSVAARMKPTDEASRIFGEAAELKPYTGSLLVLVGTSDTLVPMNQGHEIFDASASTDKRIIDVPGAGHNAVINTPQAIAAVLGLLQRLARPDVKAK